MRIIVVDDEAPALNEMELLLHNFTEFETMELFRSPVKALEWLKYNSADIAFLDINMKHISGLEVAKKIKELMPNCAIVFVTGYSEYALQAMQMHASGYLMKPVHKDDIRRELDYILQLPLTKATDKQVRIQCFGNFEVFLNGKPMKFQYAKTKELLAYLVDRRGVRCTNGELMAVLWEDQSNGIKRRSYLGNLIHDLRNAFAEAKCSNVIHKQRGLIAIIPENVSCDYYNWIKGEIHAVNAYRGEYMSQYSWGELTLGCIETPTHQDARHLTI